MYVHTNEAAKLLNISSRRLLTLLQKGRVFGAYKSDRIWIIPLYEGLPYIVAGTRGKRGTWKTRREKRETIVHINKNRIQENSRKPPSERKPVIAVKTYQYRGKNRQKSNQKGTLLTNHYARNILEIPYPCRIVYQPDSPLSCGAKVWIEVLGYDLVTIQQPDRLIPYALT